MAYFLYHFLLIAFANTSKRNDHQKNLPVNKPSLLDTAIESSGIIYAFFVDPDKLFIRKQKYTAFIKLF
jgi:hypothetical protein